MVKPDDARIAAATGLIARKRSIDWRRRESRLRCADAGVDAGSGNDVRHVPQWRAGFAWPRASLRTYLVAVILAATIPLALLMTGQIAAGIVHQNAALMANIRSLADASASDVERELAASIDALHIVTHAEALQRDDLATFRSLLQGREMLRPGWRGAFLLSADGRLEIDAASGLTALDSGRLPGFEPGAPALRTLQAGQPLVSDLINTAHGGPVTPVAVPVVRDGKLKYVLGAVIDVHVWQQLLQASVPGEKELAVLFDQQYRVIARTRDAQRFVGTTLQPAAARLIGARASGEARGVLLDGRETDMAWHILPLGGWGVRTALTDHAILASQTDTVIAAIGAAIACLVLGVIAASVVARQVTEPLRRLAASQEMGPPEPIAVNEIVALRDALNLATTQRMAAADDLARKAEEFETLFRHSPIGLAFTQDPQCASVQRNEAMEQMLPSTFMWGEPLPRGAPQAKVLHRGRPLAVDARPLRRAVATGVSTASIELEVRVPGRAPCFVLASAVPLWGPDGRPRGALGAAVDITERKKAESLLHRSERLIDLAQEVGQIGFFEFQCDSGELVWSPGQARLFGIAGVHPMAGLRAWGERIDEAERRRIADEIQRLAAGHTRTGTLHYRVHSTDGDVRWLESRLVLEYHDDGAPLSVVGLTIDITEQKLADLERAGMLESERQARLEAEVANRAKDEFLGMLGHELRNPLNAIATAAEVLGRPEAPARVAASARNIVANQTRHMARMMDALLDVGRVIANEVSLTRQPINLAAVAQQGAAIAEAGAAAKNQQLTTRLADAWVDGDVQRLQQVVDHLLENAVKFTPVHGHIAIEVSRDGEAAVMRVRDNGPGIEPSLQPRIFEPFVQEPRSLARPRGGLGIGLTIVRRIMQLHGGSVSLQSDGTGSTFEIRLAAIARPPDESAGLPTPRRVLVVDDNPDALVGLCSTLELEGHTVRTSPDGVAGLSALLADPPDVAIVDIGMPGLDGYQVAARCRQAGYRGLLIALSGYGQERDAQRSLAAGFDAHLVKPVDVGALLRLLANA